MNQNNSLQDEITKELLSIKQDIEFKVPEFIRQGCAEFKVDQISSQKKQDLIKCLGGTKYKHENQFVSKLTEYLLIHLLRTKKFSLQNTNINPAKPIYLGQLITITMFYYEDKIIKSYSILEELTKFINKQIHIYFESILDRLKLIKDKEQLLLKQSKTLQTNNNKQNQSFQDENFLKCYCNLQQGVYESIKSKLKSSTRVFKCKFCSQNFHSFCLQINKDIHDFVCPTCTLLLLNPQNKVIEQILQPTFQQFLLNKNENQLQFNCPIRHKGSQIEIRCLRIDGNDGLNEITWPDYGELQINGFKLAEFKPLGINSSIKKRKDNCINITEHIKYNEQNCVTLIEENPNEKQKKQFRIKNQCNYFIGIFSINQLNGKEFLMDIKQYHKNYLTIEESLKLFKYEFSINKDIQIKSIKISLLCPITLQLINIPARGTFCNHFQCFDLENYITAINNQKDKKIWKCPICKLKCFKFLIDDYQQMILELILENSLQNKEVEFNEKGEISDLTLKKLYNQRLKNQLQINDRIKKQIKAD